MHACIQYLPVCGSVIHHNPTWLFESHCAYMYNDTLLLLQLRPEVREPLLVEHE